MDLNVCGDEFLTLAIRFRRVGTVYHNLAEIEIVWVTLLYDETGFVAHLDLRNPRKCWGSESKVLYDLHYINLDYGTVTCDMSSYDYLPRLLLLVDTCPESAAANVTHTSGRTSRKVGIRSMRNEKIQPLRFELSQVVYFHRR